MAIEAHVAHAMVDYDQQSQSGKPICVDHPTGMHRANRRAPRRTDHDAVPAQSAVNAGIAVVVDQSALDGPRQLSPDIPEVQRHVGGILRYQGVDLGHDFSQPPFLFQKSLQLAVRAPNALLDPGQDPPPFLPGAHKGRQFIRLRQFQGSQFRGRLLTLRRQSFLFLEIAVDGPDPLTPYTVEVVVIDKQASQPGRAFLVEQQLDHFPPPGEIRHAHLLRQNLAFSVQPFTHFRRLRAKPAGLLTLHVDGVSNSCQFERAGGNRPFLALQSLLFGTQFPVLAGKALLQGPDLRLHGFDRRRPGLLSANRRE